MRIPLLLATCLWVSAASAADCKHIADGIQARADAGEFPTSTARTAAKIQAMTDCHIDMGPPLGDLIQLELDLAGKIDRGEITKDQATAQMQLAVARTKSQSERQAKAPSGQNPVARFLKGYAAAQPKVTTCNTDALGTTRCTER